jgi:hypothetical protein
MPNQGALPAPEGFGLPEHFFVIPENCQGKSFRTFVYVPVLLGKFKTLISLGGFVIK